MRRALVIGLVLASVAPAWAKGEEDEEEQTTDDEASDEEQGSDEDAAPKDKGKEATKQEEDTTDQALRPKQDLSGHDLGTKKRENEFERERFFVDKVDTEKTEDGTLVQGSFAASSFVYSESGGNYEVTNAGSNAGRLRAFLDLRLQTDFRHISASRWEARVDARARLVNSIANGGVLDTDPNHVQPGTYGSNEYDLRELWLVHSGNRSDVFIGRQFVPDLGAVKLDGIRIDYASSAKLTFIGFGGLYPVRGSRSLTTDYPMLFADDTRPKLKDEPYVATGGFGGAYRTINSYGAIGGVTMVPMKGESARFYATSTGYIRSGPKLDFYHFALVDLLGSAASASSAHVQLTNVSAGINGKPDQRLRLTASINHVDTETLNMQANGFLKDVDLQPGGNPVVQNEAYILRLATNAVRAGVSASLGKLQRVELSTAVSYRNRPGFTLTTPDTTVMDITILPATSVEVWASLVDRRSIAGLRLGVDGSRSFGVGQLAYQRSTSLMLRAMASHEIAGGRGEWEAEVSYTAIKDSVIGMTVPNCLAGPPAGASTQSCYGSSSNTLISGGGQLFYRLRPDWFAIGTLYLLRIGNVRSDNVTDPTITGITGFARIAKRF